MMGLPRSSGGAGRLRSLDLPAEARGERLDRALAALLPEESRASLQRLMRGGRVRVLGREARPSYTVQGGERVEVDWPPVEPSTIEAQDLPLVFLYEDEDLLVVDKAPGMSVHPGAGHRNGTLVNALLFHRPGLSVIGGVERPGIVHRLDRETSGVLAVARTDQAHRTLARQFKNREVRKIYEALAWGRPRHLEGEVQGAIGRHPQSRTRMALRPDGREARTRYAVTARYGALTWFEVRPETGRTHQIRVHLASIGHPILGDRLYGGRRPTRGLPQALIDALDGYDGLALHARSLAFAHPRSGAWIEIQAPRPAGLAELLGRLERTAPVDGKDSRSGR